MTSEITLFDYWRSSASYRVRIALNLLGLDYKTVSVNLLEKEHKSQTHMKRNPQGLVPVLEIDGHSFTQSLAILEYLELTRNLELFPESPVLRTKIMALAHTLAVDVHPVCNLSVVSHVVKLAADKENIRENWMKKFIRQGLLAFETLLKEFEISPYINGDKPGLAEICLLPQIYNADRWNVDYMDCPSIIKLRDACAKHHAFIKAHPDNNRPEN